jgi:hypothetical protein
MSGIVKATRIAILTFILKWGLRALSPVARALGRSLPGPLPVHTIPEIYTSDIQEAGELTVPQKWIAAELVAFMHERIAEAEADLTPNRITPADMLIASAPYGCTAWRK